MKARGRNAWNFLLDLLFPPRCAGCEDVIPIGRELCSGCQDVFSLREEMRSCVLCRRESQGCRCGEKANLCAVPFRYDGTVRALMHAFKFDRRRTLAEPFAAAMADSVRLLEGVHFDVVCDVPMSKKRLRARGFNPSEDLARLVADKLDVPYEPLLEKVQDNRAQHLLSANERRENVRGVYENRAGADVRGRTVLVCDDIMTTGSTLSECLLTLQAAGAKTVYCVAASATAHGKT